MKTTTFEKAKPGDRVWDIRKGWGTVVCNHVDGAYPIKVNFDNEPNDTFTLEGKSFKPDLNPTLFWDELKFVVPEQPPRAKLIHGVEIPNISFQPKEQERYYFPKPTSKNFFSSNDYSSEYEKEDVYQAQNGLCYPYTDEGKEAAILHAKAMLGIS
jgi:hypothetical protein